MYVSSLVLLLGCSALKKMDRVVISLCVLWITVIVQLTSPLLCKHETNYVHWIFLPYPSFLSSMANWLVPLPRLGVIRRLCGLLLCLYWKVFYLWLISLWRPPVLCAIVKIWAHSWMSPCICFWQSSILISNCPCSLRASFWLSNMSLSVEWLWRFFIESLSHLSMIKLVEQLQMGMGNYI